MVTSKLLIAGTIFAALLPRISAAPAPAAPGQTPPLAWVFQMRRDSQGSPHTAVLLRVGGRLVPVLRDAADEFRTLARAGYKEKGVPAPALTACAGWWAGQGDDLYVIRRAHSLIVFRREEDEQVPALPWKRLQIIPLR